MILSPAREVAVEHLIPAGTSDYACELSGFQEQEHPAGEVGIRVRIQTDMTHDSFEFEGHAKHVLAARLLGALPKFPPRHKHGPADVVVVRLELPCNHHG